jgi:hypothetical protein
VTLDTGDRRSQHLESVLPYVGLADDRHCMHLTARD